MASLLTSPEMAQHRRGVIKYRGMSEVSLGLRNRSPTRNSWARCSEISVLLMNKPPTRAKRITGDIGDLRRGRRIRKSPVDLVVHLPDERTVVYSASERMLKKMLSASEAKSGLIERLRQLDADNDMIIIATAKGASTPIEKLALELERNMPAGARFLLDAAERGKAATLTADFCADPVAKLLLEAYDADDAVKLKELIDETLTTTKSSFGDGRDELLKHAPPGVEKWGVELIEQVFDGITVAQDGKTVTGTLKRPEALAEFPKILTMIVERTLRREGRLEGDVGMIAVYEVDMDAAPPGFKMSDVGMRQLMAAIDHRLNPSGHTSGRLRKLDDGRIEVSIFRADPDVMQRIADLLPRAGTLEFRILANQRDHPELIERARKSDAQTLSDAGGNRLAWWVPVQDEGVAWVGDKEIAVRTVRKDDGQVLEVLVVDDKFDVDGRYLTNVAGDTDEVGNPCLRIELNTSGSKLFAGLTGNNLPDETSRFARRLGILLDGNLYSAPLIMTTVSNEAKITGRFTKEEVQDIVDLLRAGTLPVAIRKVEQSVADAGKQPLP